MTTTTARPTRTIIEFHALQTVPPSCINRDDSGSPKTAIYGGVRRARVSSQAWKAAIRRYFTNLDNTLAGVRTKSVHEAVFARTSLPATPATITLLTTLLGVAGISAKPNKVTGKMETEALTFIAPAQLDQIAATLDALYANADVKAAADAFDNVKQPADTTTDATTTDDPDLFTAPAPKTKGKGAPKKDEKSPTQVALDDALAPFKVKGQLIASLSDALKSKHSLDIALFGRMMASGKDLNVDAACQVAHAISVHPDSAESDYFTAVDDLIRDNENDERGNEAVTRMIGTVEFNSSTLYRYATVNVNGLLDNLDGNIDATVNGVAAFAEAFTKSMPTGKQNTFANATLPEVFIVTVRGDQAINMAAAFERAIPLGDGFRAAATEALAREIIQVEDAYGLEPVARFVVATDPTTHETVTNLGPIITLPQLLEKLRTVVKDRTEVTA